MRIRLFEFGDQPWCPALFREFGTDYLETLFRLTGAYRPAVPLIARVAKETGSREIVDLCSGAGGPLLSLLHPLSEEVGSVTIRLTDRFPNPHAFERMAQLSDGAIHGETEPVDVLDPDAPLEGMRTQFDALHHFEPDQVRRIFENAARANAPIAVFDAVNRAPSMVLGSILIPLFVLVLTPLVRPFRWSRLLFTYVIPIAPLIIFWDGLVSHLRAHSVEELEQIVADIPYHWEVGQTEGLGAITYVLGRPR